MRPTAFEIGLIATMIGVALILAAPLVFDWWMAAAIWPV